MDGYNSTCEYNIASNALLTLNDGAMIYCWGRDPEFTHHNLIRNNIVSHAHGNTEGTPSDHKMNIGIYIDNRAHDIAVLNNVVHDAGSGIHVNDGSYNNTLRGNVLYANRVGISFAEFSKSNGVYCENNTCTQNIIFNTRNLKHTLSLKHTYEPDFYPGIIDSNLYVSPYEVYHLKKETMEEGCKIIKEHSFESWTNKTVHDQNSRFVNAGPESKSILLTNKNGMAKTFPLKDAMEYRDLHGNAVRNRVVLQPYSSKILMYSFTD
jgi:parallel beta-helix repeat protein